jgi:hypothetical protein
MFFGSGAVRHPGSAWAAEGKGPGSATGKGASGSGPS